MKLLNLCLLWTVNVILSPPSDPGIGLVWGNHPPTHPSLPANLVCSVLFSWYLKDTLVGSSGLVSLVDLVAFQWWVWRVCWAGWASGPGESNGFCGSGDPGGPCEFGLAGGSGGCCGSGQPSGPSGLSGSAWVWCANFGSLKEVWSLMIPKSWMEVWTLITQKSMVIPPSLMVLFSWLTMITTVIILIWDQSGISFHLGIYS